jgi:DNA repair protein RecO (recombination protein O)
MAVLVTEAIVLHAFDYLETSRIVRLMTRDAGVQSVLARGARNSRKRFVSALDLFAQGTSEISLRPNHELQSLVSFDVSRARAQFALDVGRFTAGSMISELALRSSGDEPASGLFDAVAGALDNLAQAPPERSVEAGLAGAWFIVATLGFAPAVDLCANCHADLDPGQSVAFSHAAGGALCRACGILAPSSRIIPPAARDALRAWTSGDAADALAPAEARAHQRLLREFVQEHITGDKNLRAFQVWERGEWNAA